MNSNNSTKMVKLVIDLGYVVPADNEEMIKEATNCFYEDLMNFVKYNELYDAIKIVEAPQSTAEDIPEFLRETVNYEQES
jgi:hypothetical protein